MGLKLVRSRINDSNSTFCCLLLEFVVVYWSLREALRSARDVAWKPDLIGATERLQLQTLHNI